MEGPQGLLFTTGGYGLSSEAIRPGFWTWMDPSDPDPAMNDSLTGSESSWTDLNFLYVVFTVKNLTHHATIKMMIYSGTVLQLVHTETEDPDGGDVV